MHLQPNFFSAEYTPTDIYDTEPTQKKMFQPLSKKDAISLACIGICAFVLFFFCRIVISMKLDNKVHSNYSVSASSSSLIMWHDSNFEAAVRDYLGKQRCDIFEEDLNNKSAKNNGEDINLDNIKTIKKNIIYYI